MADDEPDKPVGAVQRGLFPDDAGVLEVLRESSAAGISCVDFEGRFLHVNAGLCRMLGYSEHELLTMTFADVTHPDDQAIGPRIFRQTASGEYHSSTFEKRYVRRDGEIIWVLVSPTVMLDAEDRPACYVTITIDITARKRAELALQRSEERYRTYVDAAPDAVLVIDSGGRYVDVNAAACRMTGFSREELLSLRLMDVAAVDAPEAVSARIQSLQETGTLRTETALRRKDGSRVPVALDAVRLSDGRMMAFCKDISDRIRAEQERKRVEESLRETQKLESLGILAGGIAHDFNNLLVGILGNAELLLRKSSPSSAGHRQLETIANAAVRAGELCQQMLAFAGQASVQKVDVDLSQAVHEMVDLLGTAVSDRASVSYDLAADLPPIRADDAQVRQVIMNLITNAAEARDDAAVRIQVTTGRVRLDSAKRAAVAGYVADELPDGRYIYLQVEDDGRGMDADTARRMFEPFFTTKAHGRGLGLSALRGIVRAHGGAIRVDTEPGRGTTVRVLFPDQNAPPPRTGERTPPTDGGQHPGGPAWSGSGTVLVVDDEPLLLGTLRAILEELGFDVVTASNGEEALECARRLSGELECVLLDYSMPDMLGNEVLARMREIDTDVPVLVLSGYGDEGVETAFAGLSVSGFVQKPFRLEELAARLQQVTGA